MTNLRRRIDEIEAKAAQSALLGYLSADPEVRDYNRRLATELRACAARLKVFEIRMMK